MAVTRNVQANATASETVVKGKSVGKHAILQQKDNMFHNNTGASVGLIPFRRTLGPLFLLIMCPIFTMFMAWLTNKQNGSFSNAFGSISSMISKAHMATTTSLLGQTLSAPSILSPVWWQHFYTVIQPELPSLSNPHAWKIIGAFAGAALLFTRLLPCKMVEGPVSPSGYKNKYHDNGVAFYLLMTFLYIIGSTEAGIFSLYNGGIIYDHFFDVIASLVVVAFALCAVLYIKGITFPSSEDCGTSGNPVFDFYFGTELYPNLLGWDVKQFTNCRFGLMFWAIACLSYAAKQYELNGRVSDAMVVSVALQWIYLLKFYIWEEGYMFSIDIQQDRAGFYICWGCLVWVPSVYTLHTRWHVNHFIDLPLNGSDGAPITFLGRNALMWVFIALGVLFIFINYDADRQRAAFRKADGKNNVWGRKPEYITASYVTEKGEKKKALLLASGYWGISRHFHYIPEILAALMWTPPCATSPAPYFYVFFLCILLTDRAFRDDARCSSKYGKDWDKYRARVPYKIIPYIL